MEVRSKKSVRTSVLLSPDAYQQVQELAGRNDVSSAWVIRQAVQRFLESYGSQASLPLEMAGAEETQEKQ
jgi:predicted transcriptional regulator